MNCALNLCIFHHFAFIDFTASPKHYILSKVKSILANTMAKQSFHIFHISDLHTKQKSANIAERLVQFVGQKNVNPDFIAVTGDMSHKGQANYREVLKTLDEIHEGLNVEKQKIILVPGNHDVQRKTKNRFKKYIEFHNRFYEGTPHSHYLSAAAHKLINVHFFEEERILFLAANSAFGVKDSTDFGLIGSKQFEEIKKRLKEISVQKNEIYEDSLKILIIHHSFEPYNHKDDSVLRDQRELKAFIRQYGFKFLLHGHTHFTEISSLHQSEKDFIVCGVGLSGRDDRHELNHIQIDWLDDKYGNNLQARVNGYQYNINRGSWDLPIRFPENQPYSFTKNDPLIDSSEVPAELYIDRRKKKEKANIIFDEANNLKQIIASAYDDSLIEIFDTKSVFKYYVNRLEKIKSSLIATSFLESSFWIIDFDDYKIIDTNIKTAKRLKDEGLEEPIKRIFLLDKPLEKFVTLIVKEIINQERAGYRNGLRERWRRAIMNLEKMSSHIEMKVAYISDGPLWRHLKEAEIACYDDKDFDLFYCDNENRIRGVKKVFDFINCPNQEAKDEIQKRLKLFAEKWNDIDSDELQPLNDFIRIFKSKLKRADRKIRYGENWLVEYKKDEHSDDSMLKSEEEQNLLSIIGGKKFKNHLDIGESYGRYPRLFIKNGIAKHSMGVDKRQSCIKAAKDFTTDISNIDHEKCDILQFDGGDMKYDVITCMMGTASEFFDKSINELVNKIGNLSSTSACVFISLYSEAAINNRNFLHIYDTSEKERLGIRIVKPSKVKKLFLSAGFDFVCKRDLERLQIYQFVRNKN